MQSRLQRGANTELPPHVVPDYVDVLVRWERADGLDLDVSVVAVAADGRVRCEDDFVFFNNPRHPTSALECLGKTERGTQITDGVRLRLGEVPPEVSALHVTLSGEHEGFATVAGLVAELVDVAGEQVADLDISNLSTEAAAVVAEVYRRAGTWKVRNVSQGWDTGFAALVSHFGIAIQADEPPTNENTPATSPSSAPTAAGQPPRQSDPGQPSAPTPGPGPEPSRDRQRPRPEPQPSAQKAAPLASAAAPSQPAFREDWRQQAAPSATPPTAALRRRGLFGPRKKDLESELANMQAVLQSTGAMDAYAVQQLTAQRRGELQAVERDLEHARGELMAIRNQLVEADDLLTLQEAGVYDFAHPLDDAAAYKDRLATLKDRYKKMVRNNQAITATTSWQVNGSAAKGAKMVKETSKLMLRAYNAEADNCVRSVRPHNLNASLDRLSKARDTIARLGSMMLIQVASDYHRARLDEIRLTADYRAKVEAEKEALAEERARLREEQRAAQELAKARERLERERQQLLNALTVAQTGGAASNATLAELQERLSLVSEEITSVEAREANLRAGFVYVISNVGAFGPNMVKIGMTRRQDPMDRVRELGDASVPFKFDVHTFVFSDDAVGLETRLHQAFSDRRVNQVNLRREFFYVNPAEVRAKLLQLAGEHLLDYKETPIAEEWHRSGAKNAGWNPRV